MSVVEIVAFICICISKIDLGDGIVLSKPKENETNTSFLNISLPFQIISSTEILTTPKDDQSTEAYKPGFKSTVQKYVSLKLSSIPFEFLNSDLKEMCLKLKNYDPELQFQNQNTMEMCQDIENGITEWRKSKVIQKRDLLNGDNTYNTNIYNPYRKREKFDFDDIFKTNAVKRHGEMKMQNREQEFIDSTSADTLLEDNSFLKNEENSSEAPFAVTDMITTATPNSGTSDCHEGRRESNEYKSNKNGINFNIEDEYGDNAFLQAKPIIDTDADDVTVSYGSPCDRMDGDICRFERAVGETLTLSVNISNFKNEHAFLVLWIRLYHKRIKGKDVTMKIEPERLPWNMVIGSGGRELRLNPITNTDMDPNSIAARIFLVTTKKDKKENQLIKELHFRIDIPAINLRRVYLGEEFNINLENYITLPANGNLILEWRLEKPNNQIEPLPSNFKISHSGRSVLIKEFKKEQMGILSCIVYSSNNIAVAKRRFKIYNAIEQHRRSLGIGDRNSFVAHQRRSALHRCFQKARRSNMRKSNYNKRISRRKRYRRSPYRMGCKHKHLQKRQYPRWISSLFGEPETTLDPRVMPIEKLIELSENSDGTLDDIIPHEVHFVEPVVTVISDDFQKPSAQANCSNDKECGVGALCLLPKGQKRSNEEYKGFCYCKPDYYGDGFVCTKMPRNHRDKRIKRAPVTMDQDLQIQPSLFYAQRNKEIDGFMENEEKVKDNFKNAIKVEPKSLEAEKAAKVLQYEEEDAYLLSTCSNNKDCSQHATCNPGRETHSFCKCLPGYRGNGIFCWEIIDYVPVERASHAITLE